MPRKIDELEELVSPASGDLIPIVDISDGADGTTKRIAVGNLGISTPSGTGFRKIVSGVEQAAAEKVDLADSAEVTGTLPTANGGLGADASASSGLVKMTTGTTSFVAAPSGTVVGHTDAQTLTNKTIDADANTITNIENADIKAGAAIAVSKLAPGSDTQVLTTSGGVATWAAAGGGGSPAGNDDEVQVKSGASFAAATNVKAGSGYISIGATPATAGLIRLLYAASDTVIGAKDSGGTDRAYLSRTSADNWRIGHASQFNSELVGFILTIQGGNRTLLNDPSGNPVFRIDDLRAQLGGPIVGYESGTSPYSAHGLVSHTFAADTNYVVTAAQYKYDALYFATGSWTTGRTVTFPHPASEAASYSKTVINDTAHTMTVSTGTGTTKTIATGTARRLLFSSNGVWYQGASFTL